MRVHALSAVTPRLREALDAGRNTEALDLARQAALHVAPAAELLSLGALASSQMGAIGRAEKWPAGIDRSALGDAPLAGSFSTAFGAKSAHFDVPPPSKCAWVNTCPTRRVRQTAEDMGEVEPGFAHHGAGDLHAAAPRVSQRRFNSERSAPRGAPPRLTSP